MFALLKRGSDYNFVTDIECIYSNLMSPSYFYIIGMDRAEHAIDIRCPDLPKRRDSERLICLISHTNNKYFRMSGTLNIVTKH